MSEQPHGRSSACGSCLIAAGVVVALLAVLIYLFNPIGSARPFEDGSRDIIMACMCQVKQLTLALLAYAGNHHGTLPPWQDLREAVRAPYIHPGLGASELLVCDAPGEAGEVRHVMAKRWSSAKLSAIPDPASAILIYDAVDGKAVFRLPPGGSCRFEKWRNAHAKPGITIGYADGHCAWRTTVTAEMIANGRDTSLNTDR